MTVLVNSKYLETTQTVQYISEQKNTVINKFTCTNISTSDVVVQFNLVPSGKIDSNENRIVKDRTIAPSQVYQVPELISHEMAPGDFLSGSASSTSSIVIRITGSVKT